jgi:MFS family permease
VISQLTVQSSAYAKELNITGEVMGGKAVMFHYIGASLGSLLFGFLSEKLRSRKKALMAAVGSLAVFIACYFFMKGISANMFYLIIGLLGISMGGLWTVFMANASEQFGTNIRSTVTTTAPNFVRGTTELIRISIASMRGSMGLWSAGLIIGILVVAISMVSIFMSEETHGKYLDYNE